MADYIKPVIFRLGNQQFGVDINLVQSIEREINIVRVPNAMKYISGIVNLRGEVIPAFSLRNTSRRKKTIASKKANWTVSVSGMHVPIKKKKQKWLHLSLILKNG